MSPIKGEIMNYTYIVECGDGSLYTGWTTIWKKEYRLIMQEKARNIRRAVCR